MFNLILELIIQRLDMWFDMSFFSNSRIFNSWISLLFPRLLSLALLSRSLGASSNAETAGNQRKRNQLFNFLFFCFSILVIRLFLFYRMVALTLPIDWWEKCDLFNFLSVLYSSVICYCYIFVSAVLFSCRDVARCVGKFNWRQRTYSRWDYLKFEIFVKKEYFNLFLIGFAKEFYGACSGPLASAWSTNTADNNAINDNDAALGAFLSNSAGLQLGRRTVGECVWNQIRHGR